MSLKEMMKPKTSKNTSSKNPKYYNNEKNLCISKGSIDECAEVRRYFSKSPHTPFKVLEGMLEVEQVKDILRNVILHKNMKRKTVAKFVNNDDDIRVDWFEDDEELIESFQQDA